MMIMVAIPKPEPAKSFKAQALITLSSAPLAMELTLSNAWPFIVAPIGSVILTIWEFQVQYLGIR